MTALFLTCLLATSGHAQSIRDSAVVESDGALLFLEIRASDSTAPVVLFVHGGPGDHISALLPFMAYSGPELERSFLMIYLYQRGVGKSGAATLQSQTIAQHVRDLDRVVDYLQHRFRTARVSLIGHSWGGALATVYVLEHPDKISKLVQVAGPFSNPRGDQESYAAALQLARTNADTGAIRILEQLGPPPWKSLDELITERRTAVGLSGRVPALDFNRVLEAGGYTRFDPQASARQMAIVRAMVDEVGRLDLEPRLPGASTPLLLIVGGRDLIVTPSSVKPGYDRYGGPKQWVVFEGSTHLPFVDATERFVNVVTKFLQASS